MKKTAKSPKPNPVSMQNEVARLEGIMQALDDSAGYFDKLNMASQSEELTAASFRVAEVLDTLQSLLGVPLTAGEWTCDMDRAHFPPVPVAA